MNPSLVSALIALLALLGPGASARQDEETARELFRYRRDLVLVDCAARHYELGKWCWNNELLAQSTAEVIHALEVSDQRHKPSKTALAKMQALDDAFWQEERKPPHPLKVKAYLKKAEEARARDARDHLELAVWAQRKELEAEARSVYERLLRASGEPIELDGEGRIKIARSTMPSAISAAILEGTVVINGRRYLRDGLLAHLPDVGAISEASSGDLRVRSPLGPETVADLHALGEALLAVLEEDLAGRPTRRMELFVFATRASFDAYLAAAGLERYRGGSGVADRETYTALACAEERSGDDLRALCLHELTHLFQYGVTRAVLPDWYDEGLAETYGGQGTFAWDGKALTVGGRMADHRVAALRDPRALLPLSELLAADAAELFLTDRERALLFYAQSWALVRYLRSAAGEDVVSRFKRWQLMCTGAALGAEAGQARAHDARAARELFQQMFGADLESIERGFSAFLEAL